MHRRDPLAVTFPVGNLDAACATSSMRALTMALTGGGMERRGLLPYPRYGTSSDSDGLLMPAVPQYGSSCTLRTTHGPRGCQSGRVENED